MSKISLDETRCTATGIMTSFEDPAAIYSYKRLPYTDYRLASQNPIRPHTWEDYTTLRQNKSTRWEDVDMASLNSTNKLYYFKDFPGDDSTSDQSSAREWPMGPLGGIMCRYDDHIFLPLNKRQIEHWADGASVWVAMTPYYGEGKDGLGQNEHAWRDYRSDHSSQDEEYFSDDGWFMNCHREWLNQMVEDLTKEERTELINDWMDEVALWSKRIKKRKLKATKEAKKSKRS